MFVRKSNTSAISMVLSVLLELTQSSSSGMIDALPQEHRTKAVQMDKNKLRMLGAMLTYQMFVSLYCFDFLTLLA